jgi:hypothetical protein
MYPRIAPTPGLHEHTCACLQALQELRSQGKRLIFVTNNSSKSRHQYAQQFATMGLEVDPQEVGLLVCLYTYRPLTQWRPQPRMPGRQDIYPLQRAACFQGGLLSATVAGGTRCRLMHVWPAMTAL